MKKIKYGIIGSGVMGREHIRNIEIIDNAQVVALCDNHKQSINSSLEIINNEVEVFENHKDLISANIVDAYIIATPNFTHIGILRELIKTKAHLLIEKPLCTTVEDCLEFKKIANGYPGVIWTAMEYRYMPPVARFIEEIHKGTIGNLKMLSIREHRFPFLVKVNDWNRFSKNSGGTLVEKCCHFFDLMRLITQSEVLSVFASGAQDNNHLDESYDGKIPDILDNAFVTLNFENGARGMLDLCMFAEATRNQEEISVVGDQGKVEALVPESVVRTGIRGEHWIGSVKEEHSENPEIMHEGLHSGASYIEHLRFREALLQGIKPEVGLKEGFWSVAVGEAAQLSIKRKSSVEIDEVIEGTGIKR